MSRFRLLFVAFAVLTMCLAAPTLPFVHSGTTAHAAPAAQSAANLTNRPFLGAAVWSKYGSLTSSRYASTFLKRFNSLTAENEMKMRFLQPRKGQFTFSKADRLVNWARAHGKRVRGHALIYDESAFVVQAGNACVKLREQLPRRPHAATTLKQMALAMAGFMRAHITTVMQHFKGRVQQWDVVNEAFAPNGGFNPTPEFNCIGPEYVALAFKFARAADPSAKLFYNENGAELPGPRSFAAYSMVKQFRATGVPIDGMGFQAHVSAGFDVGAFGRTLDAFTGLGVDVEITELDVGQPGGQEAAQTATLVAITHACIDRPPCTGITVWGVDDGHSWRRKEMSSPLPIDANYRPKPSYTAMFQLLTGGP